MKGAKAATDPKFLMVIGAAVAGYLGLAYSQKWIPFKPKEGDVPDAPDAPPVDDDNASSYYPSYHPNEFPDGGAGGYGGVLADDDFLIYK